MLVRPIRGDDRDAMLEFLSSLDPEARRLRFFSAGAAMDWAADQAVQADERVFGLLALHGEPERIVGHAEYIRSGDETAEVAFEVSSEYRGRGLGTVMLAHLAAHAAFHGVTTFTAEVLPENHRMIDVFRESGFAPEVRSRAGAVHVAFPTELTEEARARFEHRDAIAAANAVAYVLRPQSLAIVGASDKRYSVGGALLRNAVESGFRGVIHPVNPRGGALRGMRAHRSVLEIPDEVDMALIAVPAGAVVDVARDCAAKGVKALVVISAGFSESGADGDRLQRELMDVCRRAGMRVVGPNCLGVVNNDDAVRLNGTFGLDDPPAGNVAFLSQSGGLGIAVVERFRRSGLGLSSFVSIGNKADVSGNDFLQFWEDDEATKVVLLYLESFGNPRRFGRIASRVARRKPVVCVKAGSSSAGARAAGSHTGALLAASDVTVDALFAQAGVIRTDTLGELLGVAALLSAQPLPRGPRVGIVTNGGGPGILAADACEANGLEVPQLGERTQLALRGFLPAEAAVGNPVDMVATASAADYERAVRRVANDEAVDADVAIVVPPLVTDAGDVAQALTRASADLPRPIPLLSVFVAGDWQGAPPPVYEFPEDAIRALARAVTHSRWCERPLGKVVDVPEARYDEAVAITAAALREGGGWLGPEEVDALLECYGLPLLPVHAVATASEAGRAAAGAGGPVALKAVAPGLVHKSDVGAVELDLLGWEATEAAAEAMARRVEQAGFESPGFVVQQMAPSGVEMLIGVSHDPSFGPVVVCGAGGTAAELLKDIAVGLTPLTDIGISEMLRSLATFPLLEGYRGAPSADVAALEDVLARLSTLVEAHPEIAELDLNPVIAAPTGAYVVDARVRIEQREPEPPIPTVRD